MMHIPAVYLVLPGNAMYYFKTMLPIIQYDILNDIPFYQNFIEKVSKYFKGKGTEDVDIKDQLVQTGYDSHNPMKNLGSMMVPFTYLFFKGISTCMLWPAKFNRQG